MSTCGSRSQEGKESQERAWEFILFCFPRQPGLEVLVFSLVLSTWGWLCYGLSVLPKATELR